MCVGWLWAPDECGSFVSYRESLSDLSARRSEWVGDGALEPEWRPPRWSRSTFATFTGDAELVRPGFHRYVGDLSHAICLDLLPASRLLRMRETDLAALRRSRPGGTRGQSRLRAFLLVSESRLALVMLVSAGWC